MRIASIQYQYDFPNDFTAYEQKISKLVSKAANEGAEFLLFPEYAGCEITSFASLDQLQSWIPPYLDLFKELSRQHQIYICAGTQIVKTEKGVFNRSYLFSPSEKVSFQDKCILTPYEIQEGILSAGNTMRLFETKFGKIGICICYDIEFPSLVKKLIDLGANLILVPSYTSSVHGFYRVFTSCRARALEYQCYVVQSPIVGMTDIEMTYGAAAICSPIDTGFPEDGIIQFGPRDQAGIVIASLDLKALENVRTQGQTRNYFDHKKLDKKPIDSESFDLR